MAKIYDIVEISKLVKEKLKKEFPNLTFSIRTKRFAGGQSIDVDLLKGDILFFNGEQKPNYDIGYLRDNYDGTFTDEGFKVAKRIKEIVNEFNWDNSDPMTDYFDVNYYTHISIGSWNKPYEVIASKKSKPVPAPIPEKSSGETKAESELLMSFSQGWNLNKVTINKIDKDGNPLTLVVYTLNKAQGLKNIPYDKFLEFKGEMLTSINMKWEKTFQKFEKWTFPPDKDVLKVIIEKYYGVGKSKEETPTPQPTPSPKKEEEFKVGDVYLDKLSMGKLEIREVGLKEIMVHIEIGNYLDTYNKVYARLMIERGDWVKVIDEEKEELPFKVGDRFYLVEDGDKEILTIESIDDPIGFVKARYNDADKTLVDFKIKQLVNDFKYGLYKFVMDEEEGSTQEEIKKGIAALQILAEDGDEEAKKGIEALKILLN